MRRLLGLSLVLVGLGLGLGGCGDKKCTSDADCKDPKVPQTCFQGKCVSLKGATSRNPDPEGRRNVDPNAIFKVAVDPKVNPVKGPLQAPVTIVEMSDFECPYCGKAANTMNQLVEAFPKALRVVFMHNPLSFHKQAMVAAEASQAVFAQKGHEGFFKYHDKLFENRTDLDRANLEKWAQELGVDMEKFKKDLDGHTYEKLIKDQMALAAKLGVRGAPAFYINGKFVNGALPIEQFKPKVDEALDRAQKELGKGIALDKIYEHLIKDGKTTAVYSD